MPLTFFIGVNKMVKSETAKEKKMKESKIQKKKKKCTSTLSLFLWGSRSVLLCLQLGVISEEDELTVIQTLVYYSAAVGEVDLKTVTICHFFTPCS